MDRKPFSLKKTSMHIFILLAPNLLEKEKATYCLPIIIISSSSICSFSIPFRELLGKEQNLFCFLSALPSKGFGIEI